MIDIFIQYILNIPNSQLSHVAIAHKKAVPSLTGTALIPHNGFIPPSESYSDTDFCAQASELKTFQKIG